MTWFTEILRFKRLGSIVACVFRIAATRARIGVNAVQIPSPLLPRPIWFESVPRDRFDTDRTCLHHSGMYDPIGIALVHAAHRVEARLEEALAGVGLSIAKFEALSVLVSQDRLISLSEFTCVRSNVTQLVDRLEADGLVKRGDDPADRRAVRAGGNRARSETACAWAGRGGVHAVLQEVAKELSAVDPLVLETCRTPQ